MISFQLFVLCLVFSISSLTLAARTSHKWKCDAKDEAAIDELAAKMLVVGRNDVTLPTNTSGIKPYCKLQLAGLAKTESYKDQCIKGTRKQVLSIAIYTLRTSINSLCKKPGSRKTQELLRAVPCIQSGSPEFNKCNVRYIDALDHVATSGKEFKAQIATVCCGYYQLFGCLRRAGARTRACSERTIEMIVDLIKINADGVVGMLCGDYSDDSDKCDSVKVYQKPPKDLTKRSQSFVKPMISILGNET